MSSLSHAEYERIDIPHHVSGPISVHAFDLPVSVGKQANKTSTKGAATTITTTNRLYIFGDEHFSFNELCSPCKRSRGCKFITDFIRDRVSEAQRTGRSLDVFMEMPYVPSRGPMRRHLLSDWDKLMRMNASPQKSTSDSAGAAALFKRIFGSVPVNRQSASVYVGVFSQLWKEFYHHLYDDDFKRHHAKASNVRFHYCDARYEPNVKRILPIQPRWVHEKLPTLDKIKRVMNAFVFGKDFERDIAAVMTEGEASRVIVRETLSDKQHKIAKQFHKLEDGPIKTALRKYINDRIDEIIDILKHDVCFEDGAHIISHGRGGRRGESNEDSKESSRHDPWLPTLRAQHAMFYESAFEVTVRLGLWLILMDVYLICRLLRFAAQRPSSRGGTSIVYVGDAHAEFYVHFFKKYLDMVPVICRDRHSPRALKRCVSMSRQTGTCKNDAANGDHERSDSRSRLSRRRDRRRAELDLSTLVSKNFQASMYA